MKFLFASKKQHQKKPAIPDTELCKATLEGHTEAFTLLAARYQKRIYTLGSSFFNTIEDCEDFVQDVMLKAYKGLASFRAEASFAAWLMRIAYNTAVNSAKKEARYTSFAEEPEIEYNGDSPEEKHLNNCIMLSVRDAINTLPDRYRICIDLYFFYDLTYTEIATITDEPLNTVKSHIFRAKKILKTYLSDDRVIFEHTRKKSIFPYQSVYSKKRL